MKRKLILMLVVDVIFLSMLKGQTANDSISKVDLARQGKNYLGVNLGTTTGVGLSYIYWPKANGFQITFMPLIDKKNTYFSLGATYLHRIKSYRNSDFIFYWGNHLTNMFSDKEVFFNTGIGPGVHYYYNDFVIDFMIGYGVYCFPTNTMTRPTIEFGIFYKF